MIKLAGAFVVGGLWALNIYWLSKDWWWMFVIGSWLIVGWVAVKMLPVDKSLLELW